MPSQPALSTGPLKDKSLASSPAQPVIPAKPVIPAEAGIQNAPSSQPPQPLGLEQENTKEKKTSNQPPKPVIPAQPVIPSKAGIQNALSSKTSQPLGLEQKGIKSETIRHTEFGPIPKHWKIVCIGQNDPKLLLYMGNGLTEEQSRTNGEYYITRIETISNGFIDINKVRFVSNISKDKVKKYLIQKGDILFSHINSELHLGKTGIAYKNYKNLLHGMNLLLFRANKKIIEPHFLNYTFNYYREKGIFIRICSRAVNQSSINQGKIKNLQIPLPPMQEQKKIVEVLSRIQRAMEVQDNLIERTEELKQATMKQLFTYGKLNTPDYLSNKKDVKAKVGTGINIALSQPNHPTHPALPAQPAGPTSTVTPAEPLKAKSLATNPAKPVIPAEAGIQKTSPPKTPQLLNLKQRNTKEEKASNQPPKLVIPANAGIQKIPAHWDIKEIEDLFELKQGKSLSAKNQTGLYKKPFLRTSNVFWGYLNMKKVDEMDILKRERESLVLRKGDLLVCEGGDIGRTAIWNEELQECYYQNHIHRLRARNKNVFPVFYMYWMDVAVRQLNIYGTFGNRTTIPNLPGKRLLKFKIPLPPLEEQKKIAGILQKIDQKAENHQKKKKTLEELFKTMLHKLMTGQTHRRII